ncbi:MAG: nucleotidyltransferase [Clostridia bacterium]|nr:nucleotidyltransferase [Clostridia bacterium]
MKILGIVAEYNPFHNGHLLHIQENKKLIDRDTATVCVMSGDFVQRGEAAIFSKFARAEAAVKSGADLVLELPLPWALSSAEGFSRGAVGLLGELGCVDYLGFGSECGDMAILNSLATALLDPAMDAEIKEELKSGVSYAQARQSALYKSIGGLAEQLETPNNILAVEYLKAIYTQRLRLEPITIARIGAGHDEEGGSASDIRNMLAIGKPIKHFVPKPAYEIFNREIEQGRGPVLMEELERAVISRFRMMDEQAVKELPDDSEGLGNRLFVAAHEESTLDGIIAAAKSKRYALSRIRRMCMCLALGIKKGQADGLPPYARVLAANEVGRGVLNTIAEKSSIPVITKPAVVKDMSSRCREVFDLGSRAHDLYVLGYSALEERRGGGDYRTSPKML